MAYAPASQAEAIGLMLVSLFCWGSWANAYKFAGCRFELFYFDYCAGNFIAATILVLVLGHDELWTLLELPWSTIGYAVAAAPLYTTGSMLLVAGVELAGIVIAFPVVIGIEMIAGTTILWAIEQSSRPALLLSGITLVMAAVGFDVSAHRRMEAAKKQKPMATTSRSRVADTTCGEALRQRRSSGSEGETSSRRSSCGPGAPEAVHTVEMVAVAVPLPSQPPSPPTSPPSPSLSSLTPPRLRSPHGWRGGVRLHDEVEPTATTMTTASAADAAYAPRAAAYILSGGSGAGRPALGGWQDSAQAQSPRAISLEEDSIASVAALHSPDVPAVTPHGGTPSGKRRASPGVVRGALIATCAGTAFSLWPVLADEAEIGGLRTFPFYLVFHTSALVVTPLLLRPLMAWPLVGAAPVSPSAYCALSCKAHLYGFAGGALWSLGTLFSLLAGERVGLAVAVSIARCSPMVAAVWGLWYWGEGRHAHGCTRAYLALMFACYSLAVVVLAMSPKPVDVEVGSGDAG